MSDDYDFFKHQKMYDYIIMNPPFSDDDTHIYHAYDLLNEQGRDGGLLISIVGEGRMSRSYKRDVQFQEWLKDKCTYQEELEPGAFRMSGTMANARVIVLEK